MIAMAYDEAYKAKQDAKRVITAIADLWVCIHQAGGNPITIAKYDKLENMSALELVDIISKNGITFKNI